MKFPLGAMTVGDIFDRGIKLLIARLPAIYIISLIAYVPVLVFQLLHPALRLGSFADRDDMAANLLGSMGQSLISIITTLLATGATVHIMSQEFIDRRASVGEAMGVAMRRFGSLLGTSLLAIIVIVLGLILFIVPGIFFAIWFAFIAQVVIMEGLGGTAAMSRSKELSTGYAGRIFGIYVLLSLIQMVVALVLLVLLALVLPFAELVRTDAGLVIRTNVTNYIIDMVILALVAPLFSAFQQVCTTLLYFDLRIRKEGFDLEMTARQQAGEIAPEL